MVLKMAKRYSLHRLNDADKRTALLGLALAGKSDDEGACLSDGEMAALVDGACSAEERDRYFLHLANCSGCYRRWVELSEIVRSDRKRKKDTGPKVFRPKYYVWAGSFLAAAASVILFINITREVVSPVVTSQPMKTMVERKSSPAPQPQEESVNLKSIPMEAGADKQQDGSTYGVALPGAVSPPIPAMKMTNHGAGDYVQAKSAATRNKQQTLNASQDVNIHRSQTTILKKNRLPDRLWLDSVKQGCLHHETSNQFWREQYRAGRRITVFQDTDEKQLIQELLPLVDKLQRKNEAGEEICERILRRFKSTTSK